MASALRSIAVLAVASALAVLSAPGCSQQGEGERCDRARANNTSNDCDSGLTCVPARELLDKSSDLCCPAEGSETVSRCIRQGGSPSTGGSSTGGSAGSAGSGAGESAGGAPSAGGTAGSSSDAGAAGEPSGGGAPTGEAGATSGGAPGTAGAPVVTAGQGGAD